MRLLEMFLLLELKDRLTHVAQTMQRAITKRWDQHMHHGGMAGLPTAWRDAVHKDQILPDGMTMERHKEEWPAQYGPKMSKFIVDWFSQLDPTKNKRYTDWILRQWLTDKLWLEDAPKMHNLLDTFDKVKKGLTPEFLQKMQGHTADKFPMAGKNLQDINTWKDYRMLSMAVRELESIGPVAGVKVKNFLEKPEIQDMMHHPVPDPVKAFGPEGDWDIEDLESTYNDYGHYGDPSKEAGGFDTMTWYDSGVLGGGADDEATTAIEPVFTSDRVAVLRPNSKAAACELGRGTEWCTASTESQNYFWDYATGGPMYVVITDKMGKFQFSFDSNQFMDVHDHRLTDEKKAELVKNYPELRKVFGEEALEHGQMWVADPEMVTPEFVNGVIHGQPGERDISPLDMLAGVPKAMDGIANEKALQIIEAYVREKRPIDAWRYVRDASEQDYLRGLQAKDTGISDYNPATSIMRHAIERGIELPDEIIEAAVARDGEAIMYISPEKMREQPQWVLTAIQEQPRMLEYAASTAILGEPVWGELEDGDDKKRHETIIDVLRRHPDGVNAVVTATRNDLTMVNKFRDWFGTEPWKLALKQAYSHTSDFQRDEMNATINNGQMKNLDYVDLLTYLIRNNTLKVDTVRAIESALQWSGNQVPYEIQKAIVDRSVGDQLQSIDTWFNTPDPRLVQELQAARHPAQPQSSERSEL